MRELVTFSKDSDLSQLSKIDRSLRDFDCAQLGVKLSVNVLSNVSIQYIVKAMNLSFIRMGIAPEIHETSFDQWELELQNFASDTYRVNHDFILIFLSSTRLVLNPIARDPVHFVSYLKQLLVSYQARKKAKILMVLPERLAEAVDATSPFYDWVESMRLTMRSELSGIVTFLDPEPLIAEIGAEKWYSKKFLISAKLHCHPNCHPFIGNVWARAIGSLVREPVKLVIVDLDNTLWSGVVGDLGWEGVKLDMDSLGYSHMMLQRYLLEIKKKGVLLALCSKNESSVAQDVFKKRNEMILKLEDFVAIEINWLPKSQNIQNILKQLNLSTSGVVFLDDSKFEREEVKAQFPDLIVPELSENPEEWNLYLARSGIFTSVASNKTDVDKTLLYQIEKQREEVAGKFENYQDFLAHLELKLEPMLISEESLDRVFELIHKTNQFNLKTKRYSLTELKDLITRAGAFAYCYRLQDKYSDYGIISIFIAEKTRSSSYEIDTWLMSCRSMGRNVENAVFHHFLSNLEAGADINGAYIETPKNKPVSDLLLKMGFDQHGDSFRFIVGKNSAPTADFITMIRN